MIKNPYEGINWDEITHIQGNTHNHLFYQWHIDNMYANGGRFIGAHPHYGKPLYPLIDFEMSVPNDAIDYALAEHYGNTDVPSEHFAAIGCTLITDEGEPHAGYQGNANSFLDAVRSKLQVSDGGGVQWNHPGAGSPNLAKLAAMKSMYDYAPDIFLGVEFYNDSQGKTYPGKDPWMKGYWDALLASGRHVWGFANPDYEARRLEPEPDWNGKAMLLVSEFTREACLRAIRNGQFFPVLKNTGFIFTKIETEGNDVTVSLNQTGNLKFVTATRSIDVNDTNTATFTMLPSDIYVRVEATKDNEQIFSQGLMYDAPISAGKKKLVNNRAILV